MTRNHRPDDAAARIPLKRGQKYQIEVRGKAFLSPDTGRKADPVPGVVVYYCSNGQDGYSTEYEVLRPGDEIEFTTPQSKRRSDLFLSAFFLDYWPESKNRGGYEILVNQINASPRTQQTKHNSEYALNLTFGDDPGAGQYDGAIGRPDDSWNLVKAGTRELTGLRLANGIQDDVTALISENDGGWGVEGHSGIFHGYIYHNCRCVDLSVTLKYVPAGTYDILVYAHGDAPNQNAAIDVQSAGNKYTGAATINDGSWDFQNTKLKAGCQYVRYRIEVEADSPIVVTSKRAGSDYSMFNAIQLRRIR